MSWYVFTDDELQRIAENGHDGLVADLKRRGEVTEHDTLLVNANGKEATTLTACYSKYPRRMARDPPLNTKPWPEEPDDEKFQA